MAITADTDRRQPRAAETHAEPTDQRHADECPDHGAAECSPCLNLTAAQGAEMVRQQASSTETRGSRQCAGPEENRKGLD